ncbi:hypothetical protein PAMA_012037 [Pampus argenteus]
MCVCPDRVGPVEVDDIRRDLLGDFSDLPAQDSAESQVENLQVYLRIRPFTAAESDSGESLNDRSVMSGRSVFLDGSLGSDSSVNSVSETDSFCLDVDSNVRFSIWVSFCEIYNDNIHDLLEQVPSGQHKRTMLRLSQDVKGNSFIKDLRWVQVNSSEEAYRVMKIGKKNQSFSSTRLNQLSSRSHSIFSIRILRIDDIGVPRVLSISELVLCDLAGSERCSRTHNTGERLKEAGNINSSLLTLGKCINAMRLNQNAKFQHHIPFRESKLTHFLQFFFCGTGRVSMVVNINQSPSCFDETLNVLKFSALAQKVVVLNSRPVVLDDAPHKSAMELSMIIDEADQRRNMSGRGRKSSLVAWETSLEDVLEDEHGEEWDEEEEESVMEGTVLEAGGEEVERTMEEEQKAENATALRLVLEAQIREEVSTEFMVLFNKMEKDYSERLEKEKEILEERAEKRVEILKNLVSKTVDLSTISTDSSKMTKDTTLRRPVLMDICQQKDNFIDKLQGSVDSSMANAMTDNAEITFHCLRRTGGDEDKNERMKRQHVDKEEEREGPAKKRVVLEEILRLHEENNKETIIQLREGEEKRAKREEELEKERMRLEEELRRWEEEVKERMKREEELEKEKTSLEEQLRKREEVVSDLKKGQVLLVQKVAGLQKQLRDQTDRSDSLSEQLRTANTRLQDLESQSEEKASIIKSLKQEVKGEGRSSNSVFHAAMEQLKKESQGALERSAQKSQQIEELLREKSQLEETLMHSENRCDLLRVELASQKAGFSSQLQSLKVELESQGGALQGRLEEKERQELHALLSEKENLLEESLTQMGILRRELERLKENLQMKEGGEEEEEEQNLWRKEEEKENLQRRGEEEEEKENPQRRQEEKNLQTREEEERKVSVVEELKQEMEWRNRRRSREFDAVKREMERLQRLKEERETHTQSVLGSSGHILHPEQDVPVSPLRSSMADRKKNHKPTKRKSWEVQDLVFSENKRNRVRGNIQNNKQDKNDGTLQEIGELIHSSPSILSSKAKTIIGVVSGHLVKKETVTAATKPRRGRRKLYKMGVSSPLIDSPHQISAAAEEKESDHLIIKRQLRSNTCRK